MAQVPASSRGLSTSGGTLTGPVEIDLAGLAGTTPLLVKDTSGDGRFRQDYPDLGGGNYICQLTMIAGGTGQAVLVIEDDLNDGLISLQSKDGLLAHFRTGATGDLIDAKVGTARLLAVDQLGNVRTAPPVSETATLALGAAYQHSAVRDVLLVVYLSVTVNTSGVLKLGVGPTNTPTQQTLVTGLTATGLWPVPIYLPASYYALLSVSGTITVAVDGQIAMPV